MRFRDASYFLRDLVVRWLAPNALPVLALDLSCWCSYDGAAPDILPLLKFSMSDRGTKIGPCSRPDDASALVLEQLIQELVAAPDTPAGTRWAAYMDEHVEKIRVTCEDKLHVEVVVKWAVTKSWMGKDWGKVPRNGWLDKTGFPLPDPATRGPLTGNIDWTVGVVGTWR